MNEVVTEKIIGCAYAVANTLGSGFLEKVYENALAHELCKAGLSLRQQLVLMCITTVCGLAITLLICWSKMKCW